MSYRFAPLLLYFAFVVFSVACLLIAPIGFVSLELGRLIAFLAAFAILLACGFAVGTGPASAGDSWLRVRSATPLPGGLHSSVLTIALAWSVVSASFGWASNLLSDTGVSFASIGESYVEGYRGYVRGTATIDASYVLNVIDETLVTLCVVLGIAWYRRLGSSRRLAVVFVVASYVLLNLLWTGKQKFFGDAVVFSFFAILIACAERRFRPRLRAAVLAVVATVGVAASFTEILRQRYAATGIDLLNVADKVHPLIVWNENSPVIAALGPSYGLALGFFLFYFSNGLYGLSLALQLPFQWSYFLGSSYSLGRLAEILVDRPLAILNTTYPARVAQEFGWGFDKWHSAFAWIASDISFPGILIMTPFAGVVYGRLWRDAVFERNPVSQPLFLYLSLGLMFSLANNQTVHTLAGLGTLITLAVLWIGYAGFDARRSRASGE